MKKIDERVYEYYQDQALSEDSVDRILSKSAYFPERHRFSLRILYSCAALICLMLGMFAITQTSRPSLEYAVAQEVFKNHRKGLKPEVTTNDFKIIQTALDQLNFPITPTIESFISNYTVLGGRYCSIREELAAQVSLSDAEGQPCTLYVAPLNEELSGVSQGVYKVDGGQVQIWHDRHRILALASESRF